MECNKLTALNKNNIICEKYKSFFNRTFRKLNSVFTTSLHAGVFVCLLFVPVVLCDKDVSVLSYDSIYNSTHYVHLPFSKQEKPYHSHNIDTKDKLYGQRVVEERGLLIEDQLLVGFSHDPYRMSIPKEDYLNGVREMDPKQYTSRGDRGKRGVAHLYNMLTCATGCDPISYKGYGCYCGFGGSGKPRDGIDNCCKIHDECYENIHCPFYTVYFQPYYWKCYRGQPLCALENFQTRSHLVNGCAGRLCECDKKFAMCVRKYSCPRGRPLCKSSPFRLFQNLLML